MRHISGKSNNIAMSLDYIYNEIENSKICYSCIIESEDIYHIKVIHHCLITGNYFGACCKS